MAQIRELISHFSTIADQLQKELYIVAAIDQQIGDQKAQFDEVRAETEALRNEREGLTAQISEAKAELDELRTEKAQREKEIKELSAELNSRRNTLEQIRKRLEAA